MFPHARGAHKKTMCFECLRTLEVRDLLAYAFLLSALSMLGAPRACDTSWEGETLAVFYKAAIRGDSRIFCCRFYGSL